MKSITSLYRSIHRSSCVIVDLFLTEPVFRTAVHHAVAEAETVVVHRLAQDGGRRPFRIKVGIAAGKGRKDLRGSPPTALAVFRLAEGLVDHLHQIDGTLVRHVLLYQRLYLVIFQPEPLSTIKQMQGLGIELAMVQIASEVDVLASRNAYADESARTRSAI